MKLCILTFGIVAAFGIYARVGRADVPTELELAITNTRITIASFDRNVSVFQELIRDFSESNPTPATIDVRIIKAQLEVASLIFESYRERINRDLLPLFEQAELLPVLKLEFADIQDALQEKSSSTVKSVSRTNQTEKILSKATSLLYDTGSIGRHIDDINRSYFAHGYRCYAQIAIDASCSP